MGRTAVVQSGPQKQIDNYFEDKPEFVPGLIVGQRSSVKDFVVYLAPTPLEPVEDEKPKAKFTKFENLDTEWMKEHSQQILRMLPGGVDVIGVFFASCSDIFQSQVGMELARKFVKELHGGKEANEDYLVLLIDTRTLKTLCKAMEIGSNASKALKPIDFRNETDPLKWQHLQGKFILDFPITFNEEKACGTLLEKIKLAMTPMERTVNNALVLIDEQFRSSTEMLDVKQELVKETKGGKKGKPKRHPVEDDEDSDLEDEEPKTYEVQIFLQDDGDSGVDCEFETSASRMRIGGKMAVHAFVNGRATVADAVRAIKQDIVRSIMGRCEMHCDSLVGVETQGSGDEVTSVF